MERGRHFSRVAALIQLQPKGFIDEEVIEGDRLQFRSYCVGTLAPREHRHARPHAQKRKASTYPILRIHKGLSRFNSISLGPLLAR